jgi:hypothetical protein
LIALSAASFNVSGCSFLHNTATEDGGAMVSGSPLHVEEVRWIARECKSIMRCVSCRHHNARC